MKILRRLHKPEDHAEATLHEAPEPKPTRQSKKKLKEIRAEQARAAFRQTRYILHEWKRHKDHVYVEPTILSHGILEVEGKDQKTGHYVHVLLIDKYAPVFTTGDWDKLHHLVHKEGAHLRIKNRYQPTEVVFGQRMSWKLQRLIKKIDEATEIEPPDPREVLAKETIVALRDSKDQDNTRILEMYTMLIVSAASKTVLDLAVSNLKKHYENVGGAMDDLEREQGEGWRKSAPMHHSLTSASQFFEKYHKGHVTMDRIAARTYPMTNGSSRVAYGAYVGCRTEDGSFRFENICDPDQPGAQNITVLGKTGEGKSFFMKALAQSLMDEGVRVFVFDLDGEWRDLCEKVGGIYIDQTTEEGKYFEAMTIMPRLPEVDHESIKYNKSRYRLAEKNTIRSFSMMAETITKPELNQLGHAIEATFLAAGVLRNPNHQETWEAPYAGPRPTIHGVYAQLKARAADPSNPKRQHAESLIDKIEIYFDGIYASDMFGQEEQMNFDSQAPMIVYRVGRGDTGDEAIVDEETKQSQMKLAMSCDIVNAHIQRLKIEGVRFSAVIVDEGQRQVQNIHLRRKIFDWYTSIRKWNGMMILGANTPAVMLSSDEGKGMWQNTNVRVYFYMEREAVNSLAAESEVPQEIQERISQNEQTNRYILEYNKTFDELKMVVPQNEARLYRTRGLRQTG